MRCQCALSDQPSIIPKQCSTFCSIRRDNIKVLNFFSRIETHLPIKYFICLTGDFNEIKLKNESITILIYSISFARNWLKWNTDIFMGEIEINAVYSTKFFEIHLDQGFPWDFYAVFMLTIILGHTSFEETVHIGLLPYSGTDDNELWSNLHLSYRVVMCVLCVCRGGGGGILKLKMLLKYFLLQKPAVIILRADQLSKILKFNLLTLRSLPLNSIKSILFQI